MAVRVPVKEESAKADIGQESVNAATKNSKIFVYDNSRTASYLITPHVLRAYFAKKRIVSKTKNSVIVHLVKKGETMQSIANQYKINVDTLRSMNIFLNNQEPKPAIFIFVPESKAEKYVYYDQVQTSYLAEDVYLVVETKGLRKQKITAEIWCAWFKVPEKMNRQKSIFEKDEADAEIFEANVSNEAANTEYVNSYTLIDAAIVELKLFPFSKQEKKKLLDIIYQSISSKGYLYLKIQTEVDAYYGLRSFRKMKEGWFLDQSNEFFMLEKKDWYNPVNNPQRNKYNSGGSEKPVSSAYGDVRDNYTKYHSGVDFFALPGTNVYACVNGTIVKSYTSASAGEVICLKAYDIHDAIVQMNHVNYSLEFTQGEEIGIEITNEKELYFTYMHLTSRNKSVGDIVYCGELIGTSGVSGSIANGIASPHLHWEVSTIQDPYGTGKTKRTNPARFVLLNSYNTQEQDDSSNFKYYQNGTRIRRK